MGKTYRSLDEWFQLVTEARQSGLSDNAWCIANGINTKAFYHAIERMRKKSYVFPERNKLITQSHEKPDIVPVDIVSDNSPEYNTNLPADISKQNPHIDISYTVEIEINGAVVRISNDVNPMLLSKTLQIIGGMKC